MQKKLLLLGLVFIGNNICASEDKSDRTDSPTDLVINQIKTARQLGIITLDQKLLSIHDARIAKNLLKTEGKPDVCHLCGFHLRSHIGRDRGERWCEINHLLLKDSLKPFLTSAARIALEAEQATLESPRKY